MTVYNITKVIDKTLLNSIKVYLNVDKVTVFYTDWGNKFGVRVSDKFHNASKERLNIINKVLWNKLSLKPITMFTNCPKVDVHNASLIRQYGRTYKRTQKGFNYGNHLLHRNERPIHKGIRLEI